MTTDQPVLRSDQLFAGYVPDADVLRGVTIDVHEGEIVTIVGPNGAGKSTLLKCIFGLVAARAGRVLLAGEDITRWRPHVIAKSGVGYVPQLNNVFPSLTVAENLEMGLLDRSHTHEQLERVYEMFPRLRERRRQRSRTLSGGERQMVAMGRALMSDPHLLLLDEPSAALAPELVDRIFSEVQAVNASGVTVVMVEQNARRALSISDRGYVLDLGKECFEGSGRDLLEDSKVAELYLGGVGHMAESTG